MSTARFDNWQSSAGGTAISINSGLAKMHVKYNQPGNVVDNDYNVTSVTDHETGEFTINFSVSFSNSEYFTANSVVTGDSGSRSVTLSILGDALVGSATTHSPSALRMITQQSDNGTNVDIDHSSVSAYGDLA